MTPEERLTRIENVLENTAEQSDKHNEAIRSLILVGRTCLDSIQRVSADIDKLREAQSTTDEKLNILVDTVDRIVRRGDNPNAGLA